MQENARKELSARGTSTESGVPVRFEDEKSLQSIQNNTNDKNIVFVKYFYPEIETLVYDISEVNNKGKWLKNIKYRGGKVTGFASKATKAIKVKEIDENIGNHNDTRRL